VDTRCDHCFIRCNPWKRICPPTLPGDGMICPKQEICPSLDAELDGCHAKHPEDLQALNDCLYEAQIQCTDKMERCACNKSVKVLKDLAIPPQGQVNGTCLRDLSRTLSEETSELLDNAAELISDTFNDETITPEVRASL